MMLRYFATPTEVIELSGDSVNGEYTMVVRDGTRYRLPLHVGWRILNEPDTRGVPYDAAKKILEQHAKNLSKPGKAPYPEDDGNGLTPPDGGKGPAPRGGPQQFAANWDESKHPRDDHGRFISKGDLRDASTDPAKANELRDRVTDPEERKKLEAAIAEPPGGEKPDGGKEEPAKPKRGRVPHEERVKAIRAEMHRILTTPYGSHSPEDVLKSATMTALAPKDLHMHLQQAYDVLLEVAGHKGIAALEEYQRNPSPENIDNLHAKINAAVDTLMRRPMSSRYGSNAAKGKRDAAGRVMTRQGPIHPETLRHFANLIKDPVAYGPAVFRTIDAERKEAMGWEAKYPKGIEDPPVQWDFVLSPTGTPWPRYEWGKTDGSGHNTLFGTWDGVDHNGQPHPALEHHRQAVALITEALGQGRAGTPRRADGLDAAYKDEITTYTRLLEIAKNGGTLEGSGITYRDMFAKPNKYASAIFEPDTLVFSDPSTGSIYGIRPEGWVEQRGPDGEIDRVFRKLTPEEKAERKDKVLTNVGNEAIDLSGYLIYQKPSNAEARIAVTAAVAAAKAIVRLKKQGLMVDGDWNRANSEGRASEYRHGGNFRLRLGSREHAVRSRGESYAGAYYHSDRTIVLDPSLALKATRPVRESDGGSYQIGATDPARSYADRVRMWEQSPYLIPRDARDWHAVGRICFLEGASSPGALEATVPDRSGRKGVKKERNASIEGVVVHELGHAMHAMHDWNYLDLFANEGTREYPGLEDSRKYSGFDPDDAGILRDVPVHAISIYARSNTHELIAETFHRMAYGLPIDQRVMAIYKKYGGYLPAHVRPRKAAPKKKEEGAA